MNAKQADEANVHIQSVEYFPLTLLTSKVWDGCIGYVNEKPRKVLQNLKFYVTAAFSWFRFWLGTPFSLYSCEDTVFWKEIDLFLLSKSELMQKYWFQQRCYCGSRGKTTIPLCYFWGPLSYKWIFPRIFHPGAVIKYFTVLLKQQTKQIFHKKSVWMKKMQAYRSSFMCLVH